MKIKRFSLCVDVIGFLISSKDFPAHLTEKPLRTIDLIIKAHCHNEKLLPYTTAKIFKPTFNVFMHSEN